MSIAEIVRRLDASVDVLDRPRFRGDPRHRSVADTIRWSYDLLSPEAAAALRRARRVRRPVLRLDGAGRGLRREPSRFDALLDELTHASLVTVDTSGPETRYRLLETVRQFALDRLRRRGALEPTYDRFADHVVASVREIVRGATTQLAARPPPRPRGRLRRPGRGPALVHGPRQRPAAGLRPVRHPLGGSSTRAEPTTSPSWPAGRSPAGPTGIAGRRPVRGRPGDRGVRDRPSRAGPRAGGVHARRPPLARPGVGHAAPGGGSGPTRALGDTEGALAAFREGRPRRRTSWGCRRWRWSSRSPPPWSRPTGATWTPASPRSASSCERAAASGSVITESWARAAWGWLLLRVDPATALPVIEDGPGRGAAHRLPDRRRRGPALAGLRPPAPRRPPRCRRRRPASCSTTCSSAVRSPTPASLVDVTAVLAHRCGHPAWATLAATARALPITTLAAAHYELVPLPDGRGAGDRAPRRDRHGPHRPGGAGERREAGPADRPEHGRLPSRRRPAGSSGEATPTRSASPAGWCRCGARRGSTTSSA